MAFSSEHLKQIYDRASGYCHICHKKVAFKNYGVLGARGAWEIEHSNPQAKGGSDRLNNLYPACISCNRSKGTSSTANARAKNGKSRAPLSTVKRKEEKTSNALAGGVAGAAIGAIAGPFGALVGAAIGALSATRKTPANHDDESEGSKILKADLPAGRASSLPIKSPLSLLAE